MEHDLLYRKIFPLLSLRNSWRRHRMVLAVQNGKLILDGRTKEAKRLKAFTEKLKTAKKIAKYTAKTADYLMTLFADYSDQQDILESMALSAEGNPEAMKQVERLRRVYENEWTVVLNKAIDDAGEGIYDVAFGGLEKLFPALGVATETIDVIGNATGLGPQYRAAFDAMQMKTVTSQSQALYKAAVDKLKKAKPTDANYQALVDSVNSTFELHKKNMETMYTKMAESMTGTEKSYYEYCAEQVRNMDLKNPNPPTILSYTEYTKQDLGRVNTTTYKSPLLWDNINYSDDQQVSSFSRTGHTGGGRADNSCPVDGGSSGAVSGGGTNGGKSAKGSTGGGVS